MPLKHQSKAVEIVTSLILFLSLIVIAMSCYQVLLSMFMLVSMAYHNRNITHAFCSFSECLYFQRSMSVEWAMEGVLRCVLTCLLGMSAVVMMDTHWMEMECLAMVSLCMPRMCGS